MQVDSTNGAIPVLVQKKAQDTHESLMQKMIEDNIKVDKELEKIVAQTTGKGQNINVKG